MANPITAPLLDLRPSLQETEQAPVPGQRKLVRPRLPDSPQGKRPPARRSATPLLTHQDRSTSAPSQPSSHAELFYFQKQMQTQTVMVFVLEDGERIEGVVEWCDEHVIKVRHTTRTMIYKSSIKYIYKASDVRPQGVMQTPGS